MFYTRCLILAFLFIFLPLCQAPSESPSQNDSESLTIPPPGSGSPTMADAGELDQLHQAPSADHQEVSYGASIWEKSTKPRPREVAAPERDRVVASEPERVVALAPEREDRPQAFIAKTSADATQGIPVLCYHQVEAGKKNYGGFNVPPEEFEAQLKYLQSAGYKSLNQAQLLEVLTGRATPGTRGIPERGVVLTFDDGLISHYRTVAPLLKKYGFRGTLFLYPTVLSSKKKTYMNWDQAAELVASGVFEVGSHSLYHPFLPEMSDKELTRQMQESKRILEKKLGVRIRLFAYPFGLFDRRVIAAARNAGYESAFTIHTGTVREGNDLWTLNRYMVTTGDNLKQFRSYLSLEAPEALTLQPADGSHVQPGQKITLHLPGVRSESVRVNLGGRKITLDQNGAVFTGQLPMYKTSRGYLSLEVRAKDREGNNYFRRFLYLDAAKF